MIEVRALDVRLQEKTLLSNISFSLNAGDYLVVVGPNGAGKSSLLKAMMGIIDINNGEILFHDLPLSNYRVHYHKAWQQPMLSKGSARSIQINSDNGLVEGALKLYRVNYLHADIDLWFKENGSSLSNWNAATPDGVDLGGPRNPNLSQIRRIKSKALNYFDHPRIAAILQLTPVAAPASAVSKTPESYSLPETSEATEGQ